MAFKMRNSVIKGSRVHKDQIKVQREGYANLADGRAPSSAFQKSAFKDPGHGDKFTDEHFASGKHRDSAFPKHRTPYLKHALYESLTEEEKKEYDSLNKIERSNVDKNTELHQLKNALGDKEEDHKLISFAGTQLKNTLGDKEEGTEDIKKILPGQSIPFQHSGGNHEGAYPTTEQKEAHLARFKDGHIKHRSKDLRPKQ